MALVKKFELSGKAPARDAPQPQPGLSAKAPLSKRREQTRSRARQEKAAERIAAATEELASGLTEAAAAAEELGRSLGQIASAAEEAAGAAQESQTAVTHLGTVFAQTRDRAELSRRKTEGLQTLLLDAGGQIESLATSVQENSARQLRSVELVSNLERQATSIGEITITVGDIADQTNLLALNAAIEAARAGDHGRGFAVVADEVRAFAESSEKSAQDVKTLADTIVTDVGALAARIRAAAEIAQAEAQKGRAVIASLGAVRTDIKVLTSGADAILLAVTEAESGAREAQKGSEQVASAAEEQAAATAEAQKAVLQQSASLEQSQKTAQTLAALAENLQNNGADLNAEQVASAAEELSATVQELSGAAGEILNAIDQIGRGAQVQAAATQESTAAMTQIEKAASSTRAAAAQSVEKADVLIPLLKTNRETVSNLIGSVLQALKETESVGASMASLEVSSRRIERIVDGIALVAVQINMLAVSGSIEGARAGEFGRGFAVVSSDIRKLARDSADNTDKVKDVVRLIQDQIATVRQDLEQIAASSQREVRKNQMIVDALATVEADMAAVRSGLGDILSGSEAIVASSREVMTGTQQIAGAAEEASGAASQAATAAHQQARGAEDLAAAIEEIASLADELQIAKT